MKKQKSSHKDKLGEKEKSGKKNTSLRLDNKTLKSLKIRAIEEETSVQAILEGLINQYLANKIQIQTTSN